ncbi:hypothetical protein EKN38_12970 [Enterobacter sp. WCHEn045836]|uniref:hypothetical protein n=1 Tax=Enterobacter sp. WCHEn045836 TaxID=2497434 RepID=UPI000F8217B0|nr:hypothetical protein EKN38_12970 [Enterobacter sp. WCHEn045836]
MRREQWTHKRPRWGSEWALVAILVPFLLVGCVTLEKARDWLGVAAEVCDIIHKIKEHCDDRK